MSFIDERKALTREKRISTLSHYNGTLETLADDVKGAEIKQRIRTFSQASNDEVLYALRVLSKIDNAAIIVHGSAGCAASGILYNKEKNLSWYTTNLIEKDTILGGDEKLRKAVIRVYEEQNPEVIFIVGTPVVAINNDDVNAIILELEDELGVKIVSIYTDGFKTKSPATGYDIVLHGLLRYVVDRSKGENPQKEDFINVVSISENKRDIAAVVQILKDLGISYQLLPQFSNIDSIKRAGAAKGTIVLNNDEGSYFAEELEEVFGVPYIKTEAPIGIRGTRHFIRRIAKALNIEEKAAQYIEKQEEIVEKTAKKEPLAGKNVFLDITLAKAANFTWFVEKLGGTVTGIAIPYVDLNNRGYVEKLDSLTKITPVIIANGQPFEKANVISKKQVDYYIGEEANVSFAAEQGSIPVSLEHTAILGYEGVRQFIRQIEKAEAGQGIRDFVLEREDKFYKNTWLKKSSNWYVKQEVK